MRGESIRSSSAQRYRRSAVKARGSAATDAFIRCNGLLDVVGVSPSQIIEERPRGLLNLLEIGPGPSQRLRERGRVPQVIALRTGNGVRLAVEADKLDRNEVVPL